MRMDKVVIYGMINECLVIAEDNETRDLLEAVRDHLLMTMDAKEKENAWIEFDQERWINIILQTRRVYNYQDLIGRAFDLWYERAFGGPEL